MVVGGRAMDRIFVYCAPTKGTTVFFVLGEEGLSGGRGGPAMLGIRCPRLM